MPPLPEIVPESHRIWNIALEFLSCELERCYRAKYGKYANVSPFGNTGEEFKCQAFEARAYSWGEAVSPWNFKWRDVEIRWYKYLGRGMVYPDGLDGSRAAEMLIECVGAVRKHYGLH